MTNNIPFESRWNYYLVAVPILIFTVVFIVWAALSEVDEMVRGEGRVIPSAKTKIIQHLEGGIVEQIVVSEGDEVKKGDVLFKISQSFFQADMNEKNIELYAHLAKEARLKAQIDDKKSFKVHEDLKKLVPIIAQNEEQIFLFNLQNMKDEMGVLQDQLDKKNSQLNQIKVKINNIALELAIAKENTAIQADLVKQGASSRKEYLKELALKQHLVTELESLQDSVAIIEQEIEEAIKKLNSYLSNRHAQELDELSKVRVEINKLLEKQKASTDRDRRKLIRSPVNGKVNKLYFTTKGGIIKPGDKVAEITPSDDALMIEAHISTKDRGRIWEGQDVKIEITAYDYSRYGMLDGKLVLISADSFADNSGNNFYIVKVKTEKNSFSPNEPIMSGMAANVNILAGKKSVLEYILKPLKDIKNNSLREH